MHELNDAVSKVHCDTKQEGKVGVDRDEIEGIVSQ